MQRVLLLLKHFHLVQLSSLQVTVNLVKDANNPHRKHLVDIFHSNITGLQTTGETSKADRIWEVSAENLQAKFLEAGVKLWQVQLWPSWKVKQIHPKISLSCCKLRMRSRLNWVQKGRLLYGNETDVNEYPWQVLISMQINWNPKSTKPMPKRDDLRRNTTRCRCGLTEVTSAVERWSVMSGLLQPPTVLTSNTGVWT